MPGIYLHIPFCKQACHYCNFHFSTSLKNKEAMLAAILKELELQRDYLHDVEISSVYFGGGTPSLLETKELEHIFEKINTLHRVAPHAEITLEANPDDLTADKLSALRHYTPVNRLSIGVQSFADADLRWMNRAHTAAHAHHCLQNALSAGFEDLTLDLIYGATTSDAQWAENLKIAFGYGVPHLSCYCLTVEEGTALGTWVRKGQQPPMDEEKATRQFEHLVDMAEQRGYEHYEISNFALPGRYARHNSSYWHGEPYLGIGPSAHSFDGGCSRQWNVANNALYIKALEENRLPFEKENLTSAQRYNEYVLTSLRTMWGADLGKIRAMGEHFETHIIREAQPFLNNETLEQSGDTYRLTRAGKLLADGIAAALFISEPGQ